MLVINRTLVSYFNTVFIAALFVYVSAQYAYTPRVFFTKFFNLLSVDVPQMKDAFVKKNCSTCPGVYYPVCGTDNQTYLNECKLHCLNKRMNKKKPVEMVRTGPCFVFPELNAE
ncbi:unnamed protein product [Leptosia nina]|uniref:Kazal-like domain-containing protein n=1 Tax=Leptosia nina TaxID=320188 RepID=A0AAV1JH18_9NEOP